MKIVFSKHALEQNLIRKIPEKSIIETVTKPETTVVSFRGRLLRQKVYNDKILEVVTTIERDSVIIVTQYWLKKEEVQ